MKKGVLLVVLNIMCAATVAAQEPVSNTQQEQQLDEVTIEQARPGTMLMQGSLGQMEVINRAGLTKMACCTLSQSFENSATTQTSYSDAVTGARQIQLLGLSGIYTQTLAENVPILRGLGYTYGWDNTPASWLDGISISKGASSVVNGIEGITGQLNLDFAKPNQGQPVYIDLYTDQFMHHEINSILRHAFSPKLFSALFLHTTQTTMPNRWHSVMDRNNDDFMDMPKVRNYNIYNRWLYADEEHGVQSRFDVRLVYDRRKAGQMHGDSIGFPYDPTGQTIIIGNDKFFSPYKVDIVNHDLHLSNKTGIAIGNKEGQSLGIINSLTRHSMDAIYGFRQLHGKEYTYAGNLIWNSYIGRPAHAYQAGLSLDFDHIRLEYLEQGIVATYDRTRRMTSNTYERRTGAFAEYTNTAVKNLTFMVGMRLDRYSLSGTDKHWLFTPRMNIKYTPFSWLTARLSAGRGYRTAHPLTDQIGQMATSRQYAFLPQQPELEKAWNVGGNLIFTFPTWNGYEATLSLDYYRVMFQNRVVADLDAAPGYVYFYNMHQHSHIDTWQADLSMPLGKGTDTLHRLQVHRPTSGPTAIQTGHRPERS
ncbi:MAG: TonB-dependent receptor [Prevotella sp.]|nr:TonB-dependent receptor [Prevotella sp.]